MADSKATGLTQITTAEDTDLLYLVDDPSGSPVSATITKANLLKAIEANYEGDLAAYGFLNQTETTLAFDDSTYTFTLGNAGSGWSYYRAGKRYTISGDKTVVLSGSPPAADTYYIYIDAVDGTLTASTTPWTLADTKVPVTVIQWNNALTPKYIIGEERHTVRIPRHVHRYQHLTQGTQFESGGVVGDYTVQGSTDDDNTISVTECKIWDEDIQNVLTALADGSGAADHYHVMYRTGASTWEWELSEVPYRYTAAGYIQYDNAGTMTQGSSGEYYNSYLVATNFQGAARFVIIHGQSEFGSLSEAQAEKFSDLSLTGFPAAEAIALYQMTWRARSNYNQKGKCRLEAVPVKITTTVSRSAAEPETDNFISFSIALGNETTAAETGTAKSTWHMPFAMTVTELILGATTAPTGSAFICDVNEAGTSIMGTNKLSIDAGEETSLTAATPPDLTDATIAKGAKMTADFDQVGSTVAGTGIKLYLKGYKT